MLRAFNVWFVCTKHTRSVLWRHSSVVPSTRAFRFRKIPSGAKNVPPRIGLTSLQCLSSQHSVVRVEFCRCGKIQITKRQIIIFAFFVWTTFKGPYSVVMLMVHNHLLEFSFIFFIIGTPLIMYRISKSYESDCLITFLLVIYTLQSD